jgi:hypothetical protein
MLVRADQHWTPCPIKDGKMPISWPRCHSEKIRTSKSCGRSGEGSEAAGALSFLVMASSKRFLVSQRL